MQRLNFELFVRDVSPLDGELIITVNGETVKMMPLQSNACQSAKPQPVAKSPDFLMFMSRVIDDLQLTGSVRTCEAYQATYNSFSQFLNGSALSISGLDKNLVKRYELSMRDKGLSLNTTSFYLRNLRAVYNRAVVAGLVADVRPFDKVFTGIENTGKRSLTLSQVRKIKNFVTENRRLMLASDLFMFSFYTQGMSFVDMAYLTKRSLHAGVLTYHRRKTGQTVIVKWEPCMQEIVDRYNSCDPFLLPIISKVNGHERNQYRYCQSETNNALKTIGRTLGIDRNLTMYCARHSWADIAQEMGSPIDVISRGMGHNNEKTTRIYLHSLTQSRVEIVNHNIIASLVKLH